MSGGQTNGREPEVLKRLDDGDEFRGVDWFCEVGIRVEFVRFGDVVLVGRARQYDDRKTPEVGLISNVGKDLVAVDPGQIEIEKDDVGTRRLLVVSTLVKEVERLDPVGYDVKGIFDLNVFERLLGEADIAGIVLDE